MVNPKFGSSEFKVQSSKLEKIKVNKIACIHDYIPENSINIAAPAILVQAALELKIVYSLQSSVFRKNDLLAVSVFARKTIL